MKKLFSTILVSGMLLSGHAFAETTVVQGKSPFESVEVEGNEIVVTLPENRRYGLGGEAAGKISTSKPGQVLRLQPGKKLVMGVDRHISYEVVARLKPEPGVEMVHEFNGLSFGRGVERRTFFVPATPFREKPAEVVTEPEPVFPKEVIASWGYRTTGMREAEQSAWEVEHFGKATVRQQSINAVKEVKGERNMYYRFVISEQTFATEAEASGRIAKIRDTPPGVNTKMEPRWVLCDGVASGRKAYIVWTDALKFSIEELPEVMKRLRKELGAE